MQRILSISNRKGGSGKTTTAVNISAALAHMGNNVLLIDTDPQAHATLSLGIKSREKGKDLYTLLTNGKQLGEIIHDTYLKTLKIIPASRKLTAFERDFSKMKEARLLLANTVERISSEFEYIIFDTPPTLTLMNISALIASNEVFIPMQTHFLAMEGLAEMVQLINQIRKIYNPNIKIKGIIPTFFKEKTKLSRSIILEIIKNLGKGIILHPVRVNISLAEAPGYGKTIFQYNAKSNGAYDYLTIAKQIKDKL